MSEPLFTCPKCERANFTAKGLKAHRCKPEAITAMPAATEAAACAARFRALHGALRQSVLGTKLLKYFLGLETARLYELHAEIYGETRGGDHAEKQNGQGAVLLETWIEEQLGVTARSARRYRDFFESLTTTNEHEDTVKKLNAWWSDWKEKSTPMLTAAPGGKGGKQALSLKDNSAAALALHEGCKLAESDLQTILDHPDDWGLWELFEAPVKDITPADEEEPQPEPPDTKHKLIKFWCTDFTRRLTRKEYLRLPKAQRETLATEWEESLHELKESLSTSKKKGK